MIRYAFIVAGMIILPMAAASADELYDACVNSPEPTYQGEKQAEACQCTVDAIGDNEAVRQEWIELSAKSDADRRATGFSQGVQAVVEKCFPDY